ncbi:MAG: hypothetical protein GWN01_09270 [Nitrosopumilaceae archaeon]|nr:hypothetical protein [Nitrosopumilaceae archaeon]NIU87799.1 hypothetical protein [Nitrosopumilaceae archaeon]NIV65182.1 hypothetical protein [Nitrosopumilaceae archaeon]NIX61697.1 hypothetical protein [Nitrosopumilaceae archaeon]
MLGKTHLNIKEDKNKKMIEPVQCAKCQINIPTWILEEYINEYLQEMNKEAEYFDKELWIELKKLLHELDFPWEEIQEVTAVEAIDYIRDVIYEIEKK